MALGDGDRLRWTRVPDLVVRRLAYRSQRKVRQLRHVNDDGEITSILSVQSLYRLTQQSAADLDQVWHQKSR